MKHVRVFLPLAVCGLAIVLSACDKPAPPANPPPVAPPKDPVKPGDPPKDPIPAADAAWKPRVAPIAGDIIVAVVDTGVDAEHPALKGKVLEGVNLAPIPGDTKDQVGHGTAVAGLICADSEEDQFDGVCAKLPVKIFPIKVTTPLDSSALPTVVGLAVQEAVKRGAHVICVPMGGSFTSDALEEGMAQAKEKGVLVLAAAGVGSPATHDFYPAAHPWAVSCTGEREASKEKFGGKEVQWYYRAELANHSGKTELMGPIFAKVIAPGGGFASLQGTSVACAQAAGLAARLMAANRGWSAQRVRDVLTLSGSPDFSGNGFLECPARHIDAEILASQCGNAAARPADLAMLWTLPSADPKPGQVFEVIATVRNLGGSTGSGTLKCRLISKTDGTSVDIGEMQPGESRQVRVTMPSLEKGEYDYDAVLTQTSDGNLANDRLRCTIVSNPSAGSALCFLNCLEGMRSDSDKVVLRSVISNPNNNPIETKLIVAISDPKAEISLKLGAGESREIQLALTLAKPEEGKTGSVVGLEIKENDRLFGRENILLDLSRGAYSPQYADVWGLKEVIVDAPASIATSSSTIPFMLFTPEIHTAQIPEKFKYISEDRERTYAASGLWISDIMIDLLDSDLASAYRPTGRFDVDFPIGRGLFIAHQPLGTDNLIGPRTTWHDHGSYRVENWCGTAFKRNEFLGWKYHDGWHAIIMVPRGDIEYFKDKIYAGVRPHYFRVGVRYFDLSAHPVALESDPDDRRRSKKPTELWQESVLRVDFNVDPPRLDAEGHYFDVHVHTASEFSRDAVEPRLAFGGPPWMIARCAHAMGLIGDSHLLTTLLRVHPKGQSFAAKNGLRLDTDVLITTDHNCFLTDRDEPSAAPFGGRFGGYEFGMLRQYFGRGANQELAMAKPFAAAGAMHALVYGAEPLKGPWHGGRGIAPMLAAVRDTLDGITMADDVLRFLDWVPATKNLRPPTDVIAKALHLLKYGTLASGKTSEGVRDGLQKTFQAILEQKTGGKVDIELVRKFCDIWGDLEKNDVRNLLEELKAILEKAEKRQESNPWSVDRTEDALLPGNNSFVAAHPFLGTTPIATEDAPRTPGDLAWQEGELKRAANLAGGFKDAGRYPHRFPFRGVQLWNEPQLHSTKLDRPADLTALNIWRTGVLRPNLKWHDELSFGYHYYLKELVQPGLRWSFAPDRPREDGATRIMLRKFFHLAGSDAHGSFNYTTGVGATMFTEPKFEAMFALLGFGHGTETHTSHYGAARVYAAKPSVDEFLEGRIVCTDGPIVWPELDTDVCFDSLTSIWHESWRVATKGINADGEIGGGGKFDGTRTALARRGCPDMALRWRAAGDKGLKGPVKRLEVYRVTASQERVARSVRGMPAPFLDPVSVFTNADGPGQQYALLGGTFGPEEPQALLIGGYTADSDASLFDVEQRRCLANPIWISTVLIGATVTPVVVDGKAFVPKGGFVATFRTDHSVADSQASGGGNGVPPVVWAKQLNVVGDSVMATYRLVPVYRGETVGWWDNEEKQIGGKLVRQADCVMTAVNDLMIPLGPDWYPMEGIDTFAVIWDNPRDAFGNALNAVANLVAVGVPAGTVTSGDGGGSGDSGGPPKEKPVETGRGGNGGPPDTATLNVRPGEKVQLPKGATCDGKKIPPGEWTVPALPDGGLSLVVSCGTQTLTLLLASGAAPAPAFLDRTTTGFYGAAPTPGNGPATVSLKNHSAKTVESPTPVFVSGATCVFSAPEAEPGACDVTVTQGAASKTTSLEAVAAKIAWDQPDAQPGETRTLRVLLEGASSPGEWTVSGTIEISNGQILSVADPARISMKGLVLTLDALPGSTPDAAQVQAQQAGKMVATARLRAARAAGK
ncbi:MAG: peptidase S8/S53 subtilisin kexin [Planctomycetota bacterium]|nr:MAG: peptidase S8/S53 subtilisin kexin [Planctomycetota bacterium]